MKASYFGLATCGHRSARCGQGSSASPDRLRTTSGTWRAVQKKKARRPASCRLRPVGSSRRIPPARRYARAAEPCSARHAGSRRRGFPATSRHNRLPTRHLLLALNCQQDRSTTPRDRNPLYSRSSSILPSGKIVTLVGTPWGRVGTASRLASPRHEPSFCCVMPSTR
jgi:hypothetical protein